MRDTAEFDAFHVATSHRSLGQLFAMTGDRGAAEDALQEAYVRAWWCKTRNRLTGTVNRTCRVDARRWRRWSPN